MAFVITLSEEQIQTVIASLKKQPMEQVEALVISIVQQANQQLQDAQNTKVVEAEVAAKQSTKIKS